MSKGKGNIVDIHSWKGIRFLVQILNDFFPSYTKRRAKFEIADDSSYTKSDKDFIVDLLHSRLHRYSDKFTSTDTWIKKIEQDGQRSRGGQISEAPRQR